MILISLWYPAGEMAKKKTITPEPVPVQKVETPAQSTEVFVVPSMGVSVEASDAIEAAKKAEEITNG